MRTLSAAELLTAWDRASPEQPLDRPLTLLAAACDLPAAKLANESLGRREALLLELRECIFGPWLDGLATCPTCACELEVTFAVDDVRGPGDIDTTTQPRKIATGGYDLEVRSPNSCDAAAAAAAAFDSETPQATAYSVLLDRCVRASDSAGTPVPAAELPEAAVQAAAAWIAEADPQADVRISVTCPSCDTDWEVPFDAGSFLWSEVEAWTRRTLLEVHQLASAYGWGEAEILALGPRRRQAYLELAGA
jgi:hypothetical protein